VFNSYSKAAWELPMTFLSPGKSVYTSQEALEKLIVALIINAFKNINFTFYYKKISEYLIRECIHRKNFAILSLAQLSL
jgi:hypothetical protein